MSDQTRGFAVLSDWALCNCRFCHGIKVSKLTTTSTTYGHHLYATKTLIFPTWSSNPLHPKETPPVAPRDAVDPSYLCDRNVVYRIRMDWKVAASSTRCPLKMLATIPFPPSAHAVVSAASCSSVYSVVYSSFPPHLAHQRSNPSSSQLPGQPRSTPA